MNRQNEALGIESFCRLIAVFWHHITRKTWWSSQQRLANVLPTKCTDRNVCRCIGLGSVFDTAHIFLDLDCVVVSLSLSLSLSHWLCVCVFYQFCLVHSRHVLKAFRYISSLFGIIIIASHFNTPVLFLFFFCHVHFRRYFRYHGRCCCWCDLLSLSSSSAYCFSCALILPITINFYIHRRRRRRCCCLSCATAIVHRLWFQLI